MNIQELLGGSAQTQNTKGKGQKELGQQDFMKLLVAQMRNQDPSNPADNAQFLSQMAQFTMVDGIERLGKSFDGISGNYFTTQAMSAAQLVGREVLSESDTAVLGQEGRLEGFVTVPEFSNGLNVQVRDAGGRLVRTLDTSGYTRGNWALQWDGTNDKGDRQPAGAYTFVATALVQGKHAALPVQLYNTVDSITMNRGSGGVELQLANNQRINFSAVSQYR